MPVMRSSSVVCALPHQVTPSAGDSFTAGRAAEMDPNLFRTMEDVIQQLRQPLETDEQRAAQRNVLSESMRELDHMLDNILTRRASVGFTLERARHLGLSWQQPLACL